MKMFLSLVLIALSWPQQLSAQNFSITWFTFDGGGGTSTGGGYALSGTVGQPEAGPANGGGYSLLGGFWGVTSVLQAPGAPILNIERFADGNVRLFWNLSASEFQLEQTAALTEPQADTIWTPVTQPHQTNTTQITVTAPATAGNRVFRLRKP